MEYLIKDTSAESTVLAMLEGGPASLPEASRMQLVASNSQKIKVPYYGGYEHFERIASRENNGLPEQIVFRWTMRTAIAE
jgi:hypothetical protein